MSINAFCQQQYIPVSTAPLDEVEVFVLPVAQNNPDHFSIHAQLINQFGSQSIILCPKIPLLQPPSNVDESDLGINRIIARNVTVLGWDYVRKQSSNLLEATIEKVISYFEDEAHANIRLDSAITAIEVVVSRGRGLPLKSRRIFILMPMSLITKNTSGFARFNQSLKRLNSAILYPKSLSKL